MILVDASLSAASQRFVLFPANWRASFQSCRISAQEPTFASALRVSGASVVFNCVTIPTIDLFLSSCLSLGLNFTLEFLSITLIAQSRTGDSRSFGSSRRMLIANPSTGTPADADSGPPSP
jgi:hypothetical protein